MKFMPSGDDLLKSPVTDNIGIGKHVILLARHKKHWRLDVLRVFEVIVRQQLVLGICRFVRHCRIIGGHHLFHVAVIIDTHPAV